MQPTYRLCLKFVTNPNSSSHPAWSPQSTQPSLWSVVVKRKRNKPVCLCLNKCAAFVRAGTVQPLHCSAVPMHRIQAGRPGVECRMQRGPRQMMSTVYSIYPSIGKIKSVETTVVRVYCYVQSRSGGKFLFRYIPVYTSMCCMFSVYLGMNPSREFPICPCTKSC